MVCGLDESTAQCSFLLGEEYFHWAFKVLAVFRNVTRILFMFLVLLADSEGCDLVILLAENNLFEYIIFCEEY